MSIPEIVAPCPKRGRPQLDPEKKRKRITANIADFSQRELKQMAKHMQMSEGQILDLALCNLTLELTKSFGYKGDLTNG